MNNEFEIKVIKAVLAYVRRSNNDDPQAIKSLKAFVKRDKYLNNIPLYFWDSLAIATDLTKKQSLGESVSELKNIIVENFS